MEVHPKGELPWAMVISNSIGFLLILRVLRLSMDVVFASVELVSSCVDNELETKCHRGNTNTTISYHRGGVWFENRESSMRRHLTSWTP
jgi:hypothetical protein